VPLKNTQTQVFVFFCAFVALQSCTALIAQTVVLPFLPVFKPGPAKITISWYDFQPEKIIS
jgi:hypothetical protein